MSHPLIALARATVENPRGAARTVLGFGLARNVLIEAAVLVAVASVLLSGVMGLILPGDPVGPARQLAENPLLLALVFAVMLMLSALLVQVIGRLFGGEGTLDGALALMVWLQALMVGVQVVQVGLALLVPGLALLLGMVAIALFVWLFVNFVAELHGFASLGMVFLGTLLSGFLVVLLMSFVLALFGLAPDAGDLGNV